jgi:ActR/RegA family two-component response regulator
MPSRVQMREQPRSPVSALGTPANGGPRVIIVDDNEPFQQTLTTRLNYHGLDTLGFSVIEDFFRALRSGRLGDYDLIFLDMHLGQDTRGDVVTAVDAILHARTYAPRAKVLIFSQAGIPLDECVRCIELGALGLIPKSANLDDFMLAAQVYPHVGDADRALEMLIQALWSRAGHASERDKGLVLEMLVANLFRTIAGFAVVSNNRQTVRGEVDLVLENRGAEMFWRELQSYHVLVECKHRKLPSEVSDFAALIAKVRGKGSCQAAIMIAWAGVSSGFRTLQATDTEGGRIFVLSRDDLGSLVKAAPADREPWLRHAFGQQL